jgi:YggT family protein
VSFSIGLIVGDLLQGYSMLVVVWCLLSWFPNVRWYNQPFKTIDMLVRPVCEPFRKILPPINGIDLSPMIAMIVLQFVGGLVRSVLP